MQTTSSTSITDYVRDLGVTARQASTAMAKASSAQKNQALHAIAQAIRRDQAMLRDANQRDVATATQNHLAPALLDRLTLSQAAIEQMALGLDQIAQLPDPIGEITALTPRPSGIQVGQMRVPLGVVGIIYESRPNVTVDAAGLCIKSGNATILRGGSEALHSNLALAALVQEGLQSAGLPAGAVQVVNITDRDVVSELVRQPESVDVIVPRGGKGLIERIQHEARVPVIKHLDGNCHVYIDAAARLDHAIAIALNAKTHRYGTCNTMESLLIHRDIAALALPEIAKALANKDVELRVCRASKALLSQYPRLIEATEEDWYTEYLAPILAVKIVDSLDAAIAHINHYGSHHTDSIVTENYPAAMRFLREVDSASVMVNASTRFADGFEYGLGAEIGISTDKFHARGPVGLHGLTSLKYVVLGQGNIRQ